MCGMVSHTHTRLSQDPDSAPKCDSDNPKHRQDEFSHVNRAVFSPRVVGVAWDGRVVCGVCVLVCEQDYIRLYTEIYGHIRM